MNTFITASVLCIKSNYTAAVLIFTVVYVIWHLGGAVGTTYGLVMKTLRCELSKETLLCSKRWQITVEYGIDEQ